MDRKARAEAVAGREIDARILAAQREFGLRVEFEALFEQALRRAELACASQALITGRLTNALTGAGIRPDTLQLSLRLTAEQPFSPLAAAVQFSANGYFAVAGIASAVLPQHLAPDSQAQLQYQISASGYSMLQDSVMLSQSAVTALTSTEQLAGYSLPVSRIAAPAVHLSLALQPSPVGLSGVVIEDNDLAVPLSGVSLQIVAPEVLPAVLSDAQGRFRIAALPLTSTVTLQISRGDVVSSITHVVDYKTLLNPLIISLTG